MRRGFYRDIPEADYHGDRESLSVSGAKTLLKAPALFKYQQDNPVHRDVFDVGSAAHKLVLGVGDPIYVVPADNWQTKAAREERDLARAEGMVPILPADYEVVAAMAEELQRHQLAMSLLSNGEPEVSAYALDESTGVLRRGRFDWLGIAVLSDYKTAASAEPNAFAASAARYGYHMQAAWYLNLAYDLGHDAQAFAFIVQEKTPPYLVSVVVLDDAAIARGDELNRRALEMYRDCTESDLWPGYMADGDYVTVSLPRWAFRDNEEMAF